MAKYVEQSNERQAGTPLPRKLHPNNEFYALEQAVQGIHGVAASF